jgi:hypothetical protein
MLACLEIGLRIAGWTRRFEIVERVEEGTPRHLGIRTLHANAAIRHATKEFDITYRSNSMGYFYQEWNVEKEPGTIRIAFFGDSFTMGHGVRSARAFPRLVEGKLQDRLNRPVETMNFGIWGSGTLDEREYIADALSLDIDHVVICFYVNDVFDNMRYLNEKKQGEDFKPGNGLQTEIVSGRQKLLINLKEFLLPAR